MFKWKRMHKVKSRNIKGTKQTRLSHTRKVQSASSVSEKREVENPTASKPINKTKTQAYDPAKDPRRGDIPVYMAIPGRREEIIRLLNTKPSAVVTRARDLAGRVDALWTALDHGAMEYFSLDAIAVTRHARDVNAYLAQLQSGDDKRALRSFLAEGQWKIVTRLPRELYKTYGTRIATAKERAMYNFMQHLPREIVPMDRLNEKERKDIGETAEWLEESDKNVLTPRDILTRILRELDGLDDIERRLLEIKATSNREFTVIVASGLPNACAVYKLLNKYLKEATNLIGNIFLIELTDGGMFGLSSLARNLSIGICALKI